MTLYLCDKKYKVIINEDLDRNGKPFDGVTLNLYKKRFLLFYRCINKVEITFRDNYHLKTPMPAIRYVTMSGPTTQGYVDSRKNANNNMKSYLKSLIDTAFELDLTTDEVKNFSYRSVIRQQRLDKLLK